MREFRDLKIAVAGTGYVGLSIATLLSQHHHVTAVDIIPEKVELINNKKSPIQDDYIEKYLAEKELDLTATLDAKEAYSDADFVVIAAPTNYDSKKNFFDTSAVEAVIKLVIEYSEHAYQSDPEGDEPSADITLDEVGLCKGQKFALHYDFGDDWMFTITVSKISEVQEDFEPCVIKSKGTIQQYPDWDEDDFDEE